MSVPRIHHRVPQLYQRGFARRRGKSWQVRVIDRATGAGGLRNVNRTFAERDWNTLVDAEGNPDPAAVEKAFSAAIEEPVAPVSAADEPPGEAGESVSPEELEQQRKDEQRRQREADKAKREAAFAHNEVLGAAVVKHLSRVKVDERVMKILTAAPLGGDLAKIAARGARLGFPGWTTQTTRKNGSVKVDYLQSGDAEAQAREYLAGAKTAADIAGRSLALLAMARWSSEDAVAQSQRSFYELRFSGYASGDHGMPWRGEAEDLLDEILIERLPHEVAEPIRQAKEERDAQRAEEKRRQREKDSVVAEFLERAPSLSRDERQGEIQRLRGEYGYSAVPHEVSARLMELPEPTDTAAGDGPVDGPSAEDTEMA